MPSELNIIEISSEQTLDLRQRVLWPDKSIAYVRLEKDQEGLHFAVEKGGKIVSVISAFIEGDNLQFRKFATEPSQQGKGYGSQLLHHVIKVADSHNIKRIWCNARATTSPFYERFGMKKTDQVFYKGDIEYLIMERWT